MADLFASIQPLHSALDYHLERHSVLASNVAHVDTPGYKPNDLARVETADGASFDGALNVAMRRTNAAHLSTGGEGTAELEGRTFQDLSAGVGNDGNYVSLDREAAKVAANQLRYDVVSAIVSAELRGMHFAATDAKG
ncbi:MAG TPA: flagellar basal body rod protein FlgB [Polyangiaceae bacterium]